MARTAITASTTLTGPEAAQALREVPDMVEEEGSPHGPPPSRPPQSAAKAVWAAWAIQEGLLGDADQAEDLTKAQIIELADELDASKEDD
ncbi:hypothetical protein GCM10017673_14860 [Streptosporangium violaceochromogenes]|nr:hypothetical protein GCM10017673_14860 [Streptosporangium violaceochromogenes]